MLAGMQLDVFTPLKNGALTDKQIADALGVDVVKLRPLLYALVVAELLVIEQDHFANSPEADQFLVRGRANYRGSVHSVHSNQWAAMLNTAESIRTGVPQAKYDWTVMPLNKLDAVLRGLHGTAMLVGYNLVKHYDFSVYRTLIDVGGGSGGLAIAVAEVCPHIRAIVVDLPNVTPITQQIINEAGMAERVQVMTANTVLDPPTGTYDVAVLRYFLQVLSSTEAQQAILNIGKVINAGGTIYIIGSVLDDSRLSPLQAVTDNIFLLNAFDDGRLTRRENTGNGCPQQALRMWSVLFSLMARASSARASEHSITMECQLPNLTVHYEMRGEGRPITVVSILGLTLHSHCEAQFAEAISVQ
jgi:hypothetical protein